LYYDEEMKNRRNLERGEIGEGIVFLLGLMLVIFVFVLPKRGAGLPTNIQAGQKTAEAAWGVSPSISESSGSTSGSNSYNIQIGSGNASREIQNYLEYITLDNRSRNTVTLSGFTLKNAKENRAYAVGGNEVHYASDMVIIPQGALFVAPKGPSPLGDIVLKSGDIAIITSGSVGNQTPYKIVSFKENKCSGYLEASDDYAFTPALDNSCPLPSQEPGFQNLDRTCKDFLNGFSSCHIPTYNGRSTNNEPCNGCVDGKVGLSTSCIAFIQSHMNYNSCIVNHKNDADFNSNTWRVFLGSGGELWADQDETISLFDRAGSLVNSISY